MHIYENLTDLIGATPLIRLRHIEESCGVQAQIVAKVEALNPAGSIKDRVAAQMIAEAEASGALKPGAVIIEPTSGNTGVGLCAVAASKGYRCIIVMPDSMSLERQKLISAYGAQLVLTPGKDGMAGALKKADELHCEIPGSIIAGQFVNPANPAVHYATTGPEIWTDTDGQVDLLVAGVGTGGTITGTGRYLKERKPDMHIVAVEPASSPLLSGGTAGSHGIQGIGANFIPEILDKTVYDEVLTVTDADAFHFGRLLARQEGLLAGISSGAAVCAAVALGSRPENAGKLIVVILPDTGDRYLSTAMFTMFTE